MHSGQVVSLPTGCTDAAVVRTARTSMLHYPGFDPNSLYTNGVVWAWTEDAPIHIQQPFMVTKLLYSVCRPYLDVPSRTICTREFCYFYPGCTIIWDDTTALRALPILLQFTLILTQQLPWISNSPYGTAGGMPVLLGQVDPLPCQQCTSGSVWQPRPTHTCTSLQRKVRTQLVSSLHRPTGGMLPHTLQPIKQP